MKFNLTRFMNLIKRDFIIHRKSIIYLCLGVIGFVAGVVVMNWAASISPDFLYADFWVSIMISLMVIVGLTFTACIFTEFRTASGRLQFLSLPASTFEKVLSRWMYSLILFPSFILLVVFIASKIFLVDGQSIVRELGPEATEFLPFVFIFLHACTFLLALFFNTWVPIKVLLSSTILNIIVGAIFFATFLVVFREYYEWRIGPSNDVILSMQAQDFFLNTMMTIGIFLFKFFLAPYLWIVSYFKMKEKEA